MVSSGEALRAFRARLKNSAEEFTHNDGMFAAGCLQAGHKGTAIKTLAFAVEPKHDLLQGYELGTLVKQEKGHVH